MGGSKNARMEAGDPVRRLHSRQSDRDLALAILAILTRKKDCNKQLKVAKFSLRNPYPIRTPFRPGTPQDSRAVFLC